MKKIIAAMIFMALMIIAPLGGLWEIILKPIIGGGAEQSFIYPIYVGLVLLAGFVVGGAVILHNEIKELRKELADLKDAAKKMDNEIID